MSDLPFGGIIPLYFPPVRVNHLHRIVRTIRIRTYSRVLVCHRINREPDGERGVVVPRRWRGGCGVGEGGFHGGKDVQNY